MRMPAYRLGVAVLVALGLVGCGGGSSSSSSSSSSTGYSIGGAITDLNESGLLLGNGKDTLTEGASSTAFTFPTLVATGGTYDVEILQQPSGQACWLNHASGTVGSANVTTVAVNCGEWDWVNGSDTPGATGVYGTQQIVPTTTPYNTPGARAYAASWVDSSHNFWLFGGNVNDASASTVGQFNDLWVYEFDQSQWVWWSGSNALNAAGVYGTQGQTVSGNGPGARFGAVTWTDSCNNLWLFGGESEDLSTGNVAQFNDLWVFNPLAGSGEWTWVSGSSTTNTVGSYGTIGQAQPGNVPGARAGAVSWIDSAGNLWLFGGYCYNETNGTAGTACNGAFNDLWKFTPSAACVQSVAPATTGEWTWVSGSSTTGATGVYGTPGTAAAGNVPGARTAANAWIDTSGNLWLFGGTTASQGSASASGTADMNDLWKFSPSTSEWTWVGGASSPGAASVYGDQGVASAANVPGARDSAGAWTDESGNFWLFGGQSTTNGTSDFYGDLWRYQPSSGQWMWMSGSTTANAVAVYGTEDTPAVANLPGGRAGVSQWIDGNGRPWLFGGFTVDSAGNTDFLNDLWNQL
jgi:hypothetical protein